MTARENVAFPILAQQVKKYLADLGVVVEVDYACDVLYVVSITPPLGVVVPKREGGLHLEPGQVLFV
jgi:hypothetical protein